MKRVKIMSLALCGALLLSGCGTMNNTQKGTAVGAGGGAGVGAIIGGLFGHGKGAAIGAAVGAAVGAGTGAIIGKKMDKKAQAAAQIEGAEVETITDANGLEAVKIAFRENKGVTFGFNSAALNDNAKESLSQVADILKEDATTDVAIIGHTDKVGTKAANMKVSTNRANAVLSYLTSQGVNGSQIKSVEGVGYDQYDESKTAAENRRVEIIMYASEKMIENAQAEAGGK